MRIDPKRCVACANCIPVCPMGAIVIDPSVSRAVIDYDECVECSTCFRGMSQEHLNPTLVRAVRRVAKLFRFRFEPEPDVCPTAAFEMEDLSWPRIVRRVFSDPLVEHTSTGIHGRGTEEVKTNDVSERIDLGEVGYVIEMGRPGIGVRFHHIQTMTSALAETGVVFEAKNPITHLMTNKAKGTLREDILDEKILSAIVETRSTLDEVQTVLDTVSDVSRWIDTVVAVGASARCDEEGEDRQLAPTLADLGYRFERAKTNMGLGRVSNIPSDEEVSDEHGGNMSSRYSQPLRVAHRLLEPHLRKAQPTRVGCPISPVLRLQSWTQFGRRHVLAETYPSGQGLLRPVPRARGVRPRGWRSAHQLRGE